MPIADQNPGDQVKRNGGDNVDNQHAPAITPRALPLVENLNATFPVGRNKIEADIDQEEQVDQVNELKAVERSALGKGELVGDQQAADNDQRQDQRIPDQAASGQFADHSWASAAQNEASASSWSFDTVRMDENPEMSNTSCTVSLRLQIFKSPPDALSFLAVASSTRNPALLMYSSAAKLISTF